MWIVIGCTGCAAFAEWIGLRAVFGAFVFGIGLPRDERLSQALTLRIKPVAVILPMPIVFALAGQDVTTGAFAGTGLGAPALVLAVAIVDKIAGYATGARLSGHGWRDDLAAGSLMNARGPMERIVIGIGLETGVIGAELFTMPLVMTLVTKSMASPLLSLFHRQDEQAPAARETAA